MSDEVQPNEVQPNTPNSVISGQVAFLRDNALFDEFEVDPQVLVERELEKLACVQERFSPSQTELHTRKSDL